MCLCLTGFKNEGHLAVILDIPLGFVRKLVSEVRVKEYNGEDWQSWCNRTGSGQLVRQAATAACILNEMIFGLSDQATDALSRLLQKSRKGRDKLSWEISWNKRAKTNLIECVGKILHEYQASEVWDLPVDQKAILGQTDNDGQHISLHFLRDSAMLHQVIIEGVGVFSLCLGKDFASSGFLHSSLYLLLESLTCSSFQVRNASDTVLRLLAATSGHPTVRMKNNVVENIQSHHKIVFKINILLSFVCLFGRLGIWLLQMRIMLLTLFVASCATWILILMSQMF